MSSASHDYAATILMVDDNLEARHMKSIQRELVNQGWKLLVANPDGDQGGEGYEYEALCLIEDESPDAVLLDVRLGDEAEDQFRGLDILKRIQERRPELPVLVITQYEDTEKLIVLRRALTPGPNVDFIAKLASPEEVALRLRRLIGAQPATVNIGGGLSVEFGSGLALLRQEGREEAVGEITGMAFQIFRDLTYQWYRSPGQVVGFGRLEAYSQGEDPRAGLRNGIAKIRATVSEVLGRDLGPTELIRNIRDVGYKLAPLDTERNA